MARGTMHAPKSDGARRRRNKPTHDSIRLVRDGVVRGPSIDDATGRSDWDAQVVAWWETWRRSPQAQVFEETDWTRLSFLAPMLDGYIRRPSAAALGELRMNEERLGATVVDRMRARMTIEDDEPADGADAQVVRLVTARDDIAARLQGQE